MVSFLWACCGLMVASAGFSSGLNDNLKLMADVLESDHRVIEVIASSRGDLETRQVGIPTKHNISEVITPLTTGRWTASIDAQLQPSQMDISTLRCTLAICTSPTLCGAARSIGSSWSTFMLKVQLRAREAQTISFVTTCNTPAYVDIRNIVLPGQGGNVATVTATQSVTAMPSSTSVAVLPASTVISTEVSVETGNAALGLAGSIVIMNTCAHTWITIFGNDDFEHIPPIGMALVPANLADRFGAGITLQPLASNSAFCATSSRTGYLDCAFGPVLRGRQEPQAPFHPTHPRFLNDKSMPFDSYTFQPMDTITLDCRSESYNVPEGSQTSIWSISNTGCDGLTITGSGVLLQNSELYYNFDVNMANAGNTVGNVSLLVQAELLLQTWSRNEPGWLEGTYYSFDGDDLVNSASLDYSVDEQPHSLHFMCNYTTRSPSGALTQLVYSTTTTTTSETTTSTETETETQSITWLESYTITETTTETDTSTTTETTTEFSTTTETANSACDSGTSATDASTTSTNSSDPASETDPSTVSDPDPAPVLDPTPDPAPQPPPR